MTMINRYPGQCVECAQRVDAGAGTCFKADGKFKVIHTGPCPAPVAITPRSSGVKAEPGVYRKDGRIYVVRERKFPGEPHPVRYAREVVETSAAAQDRIAEDGQATRYEERKATGMVWHLTAQDALPLADFQALCQSYGQCVACGRTLTAAGSIEAKIGPVCGPRQAKLEADRNARLLADVVAS